MKSKDGCTSCMEAEIDVIEPVIATKAMTGFFDK